MSPTHGDNPVTGPNVFSLENQLTNIASVDATKPIGLGEHGIDRSMSNLNQRYIDLFNVFIARNVAFCVFWQANGKTDEPTNFFEWSIQGNYDQTVLNTISAGYEAWITAP